MSKNVNIMINYKIQYGKQFIQLPYFEKVLRLVQIFYVRV